MATKKRKEETIRELDHYRVIYHYSDGNEVIIRTYIFNDEIEARQCANEIVNNNDVSILSCKVYEMYKLVRGDKWRSKWSVKMLLYDATPNQDGSDIKIKE